MWGKQRGGRISQTQYTDMGYYGTVVHQHPRPRSTEVSTVAAAQNAPHVEGTHKSCTMRVLGQTHSSDGRSVTHYNTPALASTSKDHENRSLNSSHGLDPVFAACSRAGGVRLAYKNLYIANLTQECQNGR